MYICLCYVIPSIFALRFSVRNRTLSIVVRYVTHRLLSKHPIDQATPPPDIDLVLRERERESFSVQQSHSVGSVSRIQPCAFSAFSKTNSTEREPITMPRVCRLTSG